jgi:hypothetical protein
VRRPLRPSREDPATASVESAHPTPAPVAWFDSDTIFTIATVAHDLWGINECGSAPSRQRRQSLPPPHAHHFGRPTRISTSSLLPHIKLPNTTLETDFTRTIPLIYYLSYYDAWKGRDTEERKLHIYGTLGLPSVLTKMESQVTFAQSSSLPRSRLTGRRQGKLAGPRCLGNRRSKCGPSPKGFSKYDISTKPVWRPANVALEDFPDISATAATPHNAQVYYCRVRDLPIAKSAHWATNSTPPCLPCLPTTLHVARLQRCAMQMCRSTLLLYPSHPAIFTPPSSRCLLHPALYRRQWRHTTERIRHPPYPLLCHTTLVTPLFVSLVY